MLEEYEQENLIDEFETTKKNENINGEQLDEFTAGRSGIVRR